MSDIKPGQSNYPQGEASKEAQRLFEAVWMRLGSTQPDGQPWRHPQRRHALSLPRTHAEFETYVEVVSRYYSAELLGWKNKNEREVADIKREADYWSQQAQSEKNKAFMAENKRDQLEFQMKEKNEQIEWLLAEEGRTKKRMGFYYQLLDKFGEEGLRDLLQDKQQAATHKRKIKL